MATKNIPLNVANCGSYRNIVSPQEDHSCPPDSILFQSPSGYQHKDMARKPNFKHEHEYEIILSYGTEPIIIGLITPSESTQYLVDALFSLLQLAPLYHPLAESSESNGARCFKFSFSAGVFACTFCV